MFRKRTRMVVSGWALTSAFAVGGCSTAGVNPFAKSNDFDRTFISAAQTWDLDKNGTVTCDEWTQYISTSFREADANGDGALDAEEWKALVKGDRLFEVANLSYYDANGDGRVTLDELTGKPNVAFKLLDRNQDCQIDRTEQVQVRGVDKEKAKETAPDTTGRGPNNSR
ncbi:EF-hand domain-containing protein [Hyphomicrobium sp. LHD-15]|uniref:EF-hand domain-containing protein n=1 Tax=Hyphomicrobium sp. LHD-15 TaxID=3072142 RepID=UPI00280EB4A1|nr:EF-hand domain-containing protein [Hyphomicrobium sp. LHD-15]MDQ8698618.1 EF-hand domain-containing protein [Hyphomicrobium sp. LHD-15]